MCIVRRRARGNQREYDNPNHLVRSMVSHLAVIRCRLQTLSELNVDQSAESTSDIWWQAGLLVSLDRITDFLTELARGDISRMSTFSVKYFKLDCLHLPVTRDF
jgi:hypothetical protein